MIVSIGINFGEVSRCCEVSGQIDDFTPRSSAKKLLTTQQIDLLCLPVREG
jgi:hypothetical protein